MWFVEPADAAPLACRAAKIGEGRMGNIPHGFVENGYENAVAGCREEVRKEVLAEFAPRWSRAGPLGRVFLWLRMHGEIRRRIRRKAPQDALYWRVKG
jgi:hypothetical protein